MICDKINAITEINGKSGKLQVAGESISINSDEYAADLFGKDAAVSETAVELQRINSSVCAGLKKLGSIEKL